MKSLDNSSSSYDLVIIGSGLVGLTSAFEANKLFEGGKNILILEKLPKVGGNSIKATSGINMIESPTQIKNGINDSKTTFFEDTLKNGKLLNDSELVSSLINESNSLYDFLSKEINVDLPNLCI